MRHIALIPDGIRRWSRLHNVGLDHAYCAVSRVLVDISDTIFAHEADSLSVYVLSKQNLTRSSNDLALTFSSHIRIFETVLPRLAAKWNARIIHVGDRGLLPGNYLRALDGVCDFSNPFCGRKEIYICAGYSVDWEIATFWNGNTDHEKGCQVPHAIDLLIRTGGEVRLSGFLPIQLQYAELCFMQKLFPDTTSADVEDAMAQYYTRNRRFGR